MALTGQRPTRTAPALLYSVAPAVGDRPGCSSLNLILICPGLTETLSTMVAFGVPVKVKVPPVPSEHEMVRGKWPAASRPTLNSLAFSSAPSDFDTRLIPAVTVQWDASATCGHPMRFATRATMERCGAS